MDVYLEGITGEMAGQRFALGTAPLTIGRSAQNSLQMRASSISREHALISWSQGAFALYDRASKHGTLLNGQPVREAFLQDGDIITIGGSSFRFSAQGQQPMPGNEWQSQSAQAQTKSSPIGIILVLAIMAGALGWFIFSGMQEKEKVANDEPDILEEIPRLYSEVEPLLEWLPLDGDARDDSGWGDGNGGLGDNDWGEGSGGSDSVPMIRADYLFADDFENGIRTEWQALRGEWRMVNGRLQAMSGHPATIEVGESGWSDLIIEARVGGLRNTVSAGLQFLETDPNILWIGVRSDRNAAYYFGVAHSKQSCTYEINDEIITEFYFDNNYFSEEDEHLIRIVAEGELFSMTVDGQTICTFSDSALSYGKVTISAYPGTGAKPSYPWVEDILIMEK